MHILKMFCEYDIMVVMGMATVINKGGVSS